jgi:hypothetical protein
VPLLFLAFWGSMPSLMAAGRRCRQLILPSRIGLPFRTDWNTRSLEPSVRTTLMRFFAQRPPQLTSTSNDLRRRIRAMTDGSTLMLPALPWVFVTLQSPRRKRSSTISASSGAQGGAVNLRSGSAAEGRARWSLA